MKDSFVDPITLGPPGPDFARRLVNYLFDGDKPKHLFDDIHHFSKRYYARHAENRNMLPVVKFKLRTEIQRTIDQRHKLMMVPEAITQGNNFIRLVKASEAKIRADRDGVLTTYRSQESLNKEQLRILTEKNKNRAMARAPSWRALYHTVKGELISAISPTGNEAALKTLTKERGFTANQNLRDEDFEAFWMGVCEISQIFGFSDDVADSRNGNFETFDGFKIQYGIIPFRPKGDAEIICPDMNPVTPADYLALLQSHMEKVKPLGFMADLSAKMAVRMMMLEEMRTTGLSHPVWGKLDPSRMNPALRNLPVEHDKRFAKLKDAVLDFMDRNGMAAELEDHFGLDSYDGERECYRRYLADLRARKLAPEGLKRVRRHEVLQIHERLQMQPALERFGLADLTPSNIPYQLDGNYFNAPPALFDEGTFSRLLPVEQIALKAMLGDIETPQMPGGDILVFFDRRGGQPAADFAQDGGLIIPDESRGTRSKLGKNFEEVVKPQNVRLAYEAKARLAAAYPEMAVTTSEDIENYVDGYRDNRKAFVADGPDRMAGPAKTVLGEELERRRGKIAVFSPRWELAPMETWARLHARKIQLGILSRPDNVERHDIQVGDYQKDGLPVAIRTLADDIVTLTNYMKALVKAKTERYPRHVVKGLLELVTMADLYYHQPFNRVASPHADRDLIDVQSVPGALKKDLESRKAEIVKVATEAKRLIKRYGMNALSLEDVSGALELIDPSYADAWAQSNADQANAGSRDAKQGTFVRRRDFDGARLG